MFLKSRFPAAGAPLNATAAGETLQSPRRDHECSSPSPGCFRGLLCACRSVSAPVLLLLVFPEPVRPPSVVSVLPRRRAVYPHPPSSLAQTDRPANLITTTTTEHPHHNNTKCQRGWLSAPPSGPCPSGQTNCLSSNRSPPPCRRAPTSQIPHPRRGHHPEFKSSNNNKGHNHTLPLPLPTTMPASKANHQ